MTQPIAPAHASHAPTSLVSDARGYIRSVRLGVSWLKAAWAMAIGLALIMVLLMALALAGVRIEGDTRQFLEFVLLAIGPVIGLTTLIGTFLYSKRDPRLSEAQSAAGARIGLRITVLISCAIAGTVVALVLSRVNIEPTSVSNPSGKPKLDFNALGVAIAAASGIVNFIWALTLVTYTRWMAGRVPDQDLVRKCNGAVVLVGFVYMMMLLYQVLGSQGVKWTIHTSGLGDWGMLIIGFLFIIFPIAAIVSLWKMLSRMKQHLNVLAGA